LEYLGFRVYGEYWEYLGITNYWHVNNPCFTKVKTAIETETTDQLKCSEMAQNG